MRFYLGPVDQSFSQRHFALTGVPEHISVFSATELNRSDSWDSFSRTAFRNREVPEAIVLMLGYSSFPDWLWSANLPIIGLAPDWNLLWHYYRTVAPLCDLILTDEPGCQRFRAAGMHNVQAACLYGCPSSWCSPIDSQIRDIDILFIGNFHPDVQRERLPWLARIARLADSYNVHIATGVHDEDYRTLMRRTKIAFNRSIRGECNMRVFEAVSSGALLFQEAGNQEVSSFFEPGVHFVSYQDENLESLLARFISDTERRHTMTRMARAHAEQLTFIDLLEIALKRAVKGLERATLRHVINPRNPDLRQNWLQHQSSAFGDSKCDASPMADSARPINSYLLGCIVLKNGNSAVARSLFTDAATRHPALILPHFALAVLMHRSNEAENAVSQIKAALRLLDDDYVDLFLLADVPLWSNDFGPLRIAWECAAWECSGDPAAEAARKQRLLQWFGCVLLGRWTNDPVYFFEAISLLPDQPSVYSELGKLLLRRGQSEIATRYLESALDHSPFDQLITEDLHNAYEASGESVKQYQLAIERARLHRAAPGIVPEAEWFRHAALIQKEQNHDASTARQRTGGYRVVWQGEQLPLHSLSIVNREVCERLIDRGHELSLLAETSGLPPSTTVPLSESLRSRLNATLSQPADFHVCFRWPPVMETPSSGRFIWIQPWEFGSLPVSWLNTLELVDDVWVPSTHVARSFLDAGIEKDRIFLMPLGASLEKHQKLPVCNSQSKRPYRFLFVGGTIPRKGIDLLLDAYGKTFCSTNDVCLVIKDVGAQTYYADQAISESIRKLQSTSGYPAIEYLVSELSPEQMCELYDGCDCLVHPYRAEGFGLPIADALFRGKQVIVTGAGAAMDFCSSENAILVPARTVRFGSNAVDALRTLSTPYWFEPDSEMLRAAMRRVAESRTTVLPSESGTNRLDSKYSWDSITDVIEARFDELSKRPIRRTRDDVASSHSEHPERVSLCMIVRDNESIIDSCLSSISPWVDELIIVDTGSNDKTREICRQFGARVFDFPWCDDFSAARNESLRHATSEWIFWMDSDDVIDADQGQRLRNLVRSKHKPGCLGYVLQVQCPSEAKGQATVVDHIKLFRNHRELRFEHRIHEQILPSIRRQGGTVEFTNIFVVHTGSLQSPEQRWQKLKRDFRILELDLEERPDHPFILFNLGMTCDDAGLHSEAIRYLRRCLDVSKPEESHVRKAWSILVNSLRSSGAIDMAILAAQQALDQHPDDVEIRFRYGVLLQQTEQYEAAVREYRRLFDVPKTRRFQSMDNSITGYKLHRNLAIALDQLQFSHEAAVHWNQALSCSPQCEIAILEVARHAIQTGNRRRLAELVNEIHDNSNIVVRSRVVAIYYAATGEWEQVESVLWDAWRETNNEVCLDELARLMMENQQAKRAIPSLQELVKHRPRCAATHYNLGQVSLSCGKLDTARDHFNHSLKLRPDHEATIRLLASLPPIEDN